MDAYRESLPNNPPVNAFVLANESTVHIVFTQQPPLKGAATVEGYKASRELPTSNRTIGVFIATNATFRTAGTPREIRDIAATPEEYALELVRVDGSYRRMTTLTDPDQEDNFTAAETAGVITVESTTPAERATRIADGARAVVRHPNQTTIRQRFEARSGPRLWTASFENDSYWLGNRPTVDGIVLPPSSAAREFLADYDYAGTFPAKKNEPLLYFVDAEYEHRQFNKVSAINQQTDALDGKDVSVNARVVQQMVSVQESIEHSTGCNETLIPVESGCVNLPQDVTLHGGVAWNGVPQERNEILPLVAASNIEVDEPTKRTKGRYRLVGEVVASSRINESLPDGAVLVVYQAERTGPIDKREMARETLRILNERAQQAGTRLRKRANVSAPSEVTNQESTIETSSAVTASGGSDTSATTSGTVQDNDERGTSPTNSSEMTENGPGFESANQESTIETSSGATATGEAGTTATTIEGTTASGPGFGWVATLGAIVLWIVAAQRRDW